MAKWPLDIQKGICEHMNRDHAEVVLGFVRQLADQPDALTADMVAIDGDGMRLVAHTVHGDERLFVPFVPPLTRYEEARERLVALAAQLKS